MSEPGWYPDPGGRPGHYRYWDGQAWAPTTSTTLPGPPPAATPATGPGPRSRRGRTGLVLALVAAALVLAVVGALVVRGGTQPVVDGGVSTGPSAPGANDTSAAPTPTASGTPAPADTPTPVPSESASAAPCPVGDPFSRQDHPRDGRVHGGGLSFPRQPGWQDPGVQASGFTWAYDLGETDIRLAQTRFAAYAVGAVSVADGFEDPESAAALIMRCTVTSALYTAVSGTTDLVDEETTVDGYGAWTLRTEVRTDDAGPGSTGDTVQVTVVDLGSPESLAFFWGSAPTGDETFQARLDQAVEQLGVD